MQLSVEFPLVFAVAAALLLIAVPNGAATAQSLPQDLDCASPRSPQEADRCAHRNDNPPKAARAAAKNTAGDQPGAAPATPGITQQAIPFDPKDEARKRKLLDAGQYHDPSAVSLCPPPYQMTEKDGCQPAPPR
ncbi:MAG TPA: hypothetical protein VHW90_03045 [Stellaceae bacterium]|nr:hypothetical protein [Stellaceae bacterium]